MRIVKAVQEDVRVKSEIYKQDDLSKLMHESAIFYSCQNYWIAVSTIKKLKVMVMDGKYRSVAVTWKGDKIIVDL